eukprot:scaffold66297_cov69-Phaeocystis_antarctica.AAC.2
MPRPVFVRLPREQARRVRAASASLSVMNALAEFVCHPAGFLATVIEEGAHATTVVSSGSNDELTSELQGEMPSRKSLAAREPVQSALARSNPAAAHRLLHRRAHCRLDAAAALWCQRCQCHCFR